MSRSIRLTSALYNSTALVRFFAAAALLAFAASAQAEPLPTGGTVVAGSATVATRVETMTVTQTSQNAVLNWDGFSIGAANTVIFAQPGSSAVALNRVLGNDPSAILGTLTANGKVFLTNPNGIVFAKGANVNVGGLVASTLSLSDSEFMAGNYAFSGSGGSVLNEGAISADGGYVALLGAHVENNGTIRANLGTVALAAGEAITLDVAGDGLLNVAIDKGAVGALVQNGGLLQADGGKVLMTAQAAGSLLRTAVNNTGIIEARTLENRNGTILLLGDMGSGTMMVDGVLDASALAGGDGGFIETSAATVNIADSAYITTTAPFGQTGTWLIDPADFIVGAGGNISGETLSAQLVTNSVTISTIPVAGDTSGGEGNIFVNDAIAWTASGNPTTLTLNAFGDINIDNAITATNGNVVACCGRDVNVNGAITTTNGSISLNAGRNVRVFNTLTATDGNIELCAGHDVLIDGPITLTRGTTIPAQSLGLARGLTIIAGTDGSGPGIVGGTVVFAPLAPPVTVTAAPVGIFYNPVSYAAPTDFAPEFELTEGAALSQRMLLFATGEKAFDGTNAITLTGFKTTAASGNPVGVSLVAGLDAIATFDDAAVGSGIGITYAGYTLVGANADLYALAESCCTDGLRSTGTITAATTPSSTLTSTPTPTSAPTRTFTPTPTQTRTQTPTTTLTPASTPILTPTPTRTPTSRLPQFAQPLTTLPPSLVGILTDAGFAVVGGGVTLPGTQLASLTPQEVLVAPPFAPVVVPEARAFPPAPALPMTPAVPVYPRKQARH